MNIEPLESSSSPPTATNRLRGATSPWKWVREVGAVWRKDLLQEWRLRQGLVASALMGVVTVVAVGFASLGASLSEGLTAGLFWVAILFGMFPALARGFIVEEEAGTADLLRVGARPSAVFWGKWLFHFTLYLLLTLILVPLYGLVVAPLKGHLGGWLLLWLFGGFCLVSVLTLCGALVARTTTRGALLAVLTFPLLLPLLLILIGGTKTALNGLFPADSLQGVFGYTLTLSAGASWVFERVWAD